jgi:hypothetical protein
MFTLGWTFQFVGHANLRARSRHSSRSPPAGDWVSCGDPEDGSPLVQTLNIRLDLPIQ